jgi:hypothetical protein
VRNREIEAGTKPDFGDLRSVDPLEGEQHEPACESDSDALPLGALSDVIL